MLSIVVGGGGGGDPVQGLVLLGKCSASHILSPWDLMSEDIEISLMHHRI